MRQYIGSQTYQIMTCRLFDAKPLAEPMLNHCELGPCVCTRHSIIVHQPLQWHHNGRDSVSNYQPRECLLNHWIRRRSKKTSKLRVTGLCARNSPETGQFPAQTASNAENVSIWWRHHDETELRWTRWWWVRSFVKSKCTWGYGLVILVLFAIIHCVIKPRILSRL